MKSLLILFENVKDFYWILNVPHFFEMNKITENISIVNKEVRAVINCFILKIWRYFISNFFSYESIKSPLLQAIKAIAA